MSKLRFLARKCAALPTLLHFLVHLKCSSLGRKCSSSAALFFQMVRRISRLKIPIYRSSKCSSVGSFPNFAQEKSLLRESVENPPVSDDFKYSWEFGDEFDHEDFDEWWQDRAEEYSDDRYAAILRKSWEHEAVDEIIDEEDDSRRGDIPF